MRSVGRWLPKLLRTSGAVLLTILVLFAVFRATAPFLISSGLVRSGIEDALSRWTGYRAEIEGTPTLDFWPTPRVTLNQVTIRERTGEGKVLGHVDALSADFSLWRAIRGRADFHEFHFLRPTVYLRREENGLIDWTNQGILARAIDRAERSTTGAPPAMRPEQDAKIGAVTIEDGALQMTDERSGAIYKMDSINADISWPRLSRAMNAVILARLNGQDIKVDFNSDQPLLFFAGKDVQARTAFSSPLITGSYAGTTNISKTSALSGNLALSVPDVPSFLAWSGEHLPGGAALRSLSLNSNISTVATGVRFNDLTFKVNDAAASGIMDFGYTAAGKPKISGTLAFDQMNLNPFLAAFSMRLAADTAIDVLMNGNPLQRLDMDLRLSAANAVLGPFQFGDIGASLLVTGGTAKFDIGDSAFEGGDLTAHLEVTERNFGGGGKLQISVRDADFGGLITRLKLPGPLPLATGSLDLSLATSKPIWAASLSDLTGTLRLRTKSGSFQAINISTFRALAAQKNFFRMSDVGDAAFDFDSLDASATIAKGSADLQSAKIVGKNETMTLNGLIPYRSNSLGLSGTLVANDPTNADELPMLPFFIGGSWPDPVVSPANTLMQKPAQQ